MDKSITYDSLEGFFRVWSNGACIGEYDHLEDAREAAR